MMENIWCQPEKILQLVKMKDFSSDIGKKEVTLENITVTLKGKTVTYILVTDMIICMHEYVYKCAMVISNWNHPVVLLDKV